MQFRPHDRPPGSGRTGPAWGERVVEGGETMKKATTDIRFTVFCPFALHRSVKMLAAYRGQSMNKTMVDLLEQGLEQARSENISL